jgi:hypothetical protein
MVSIEGDTVLDLGTTSLRAGHALEGTAVGRDGITPRAAMVRGMERLVSLDATGSFRLTNLPAGNLALVLAGDVLGSTVTVRYPVQLQGEGTTEAVGTLPISNIDDGLIAHWSLDPDNGTGIVIDETGNGFTGTVDGATYVDGRIDDGLLFDASADIATVDTTFMPPLAGTLTLWVRPTGVVSSSTYRVFASSTSAFEVSIRNGRVSNELCALNTDYLHDTTALTPDTWYHVACTWNAGDGTSRIYIDGSLSSEGVTADDYPGEVQVAFGKSPLHGSPYIGILDEVRLYGRELGGAEVATLARGLY